MASVTLKLDNSYATIAQNKKLPITQAYLNKSAVIAQKIQIDNKYFFDKFKNLHEDDKLGSLVVTAVYAFFAAASLEASSPYFVGISTAAAFLYSSGTSEGRANFALENRKSLEAQLPAMKEELANSGLNPASIKKIIDISEKTTSLLEQIEHQETGSSRNKVFTSVSALAWMAGSALGIPLLPALSIIAGTGSLMVAAKHYALTQEYSPADAAKETQKEILSLS